MGVEWSTRVDRAFTFEQLRIATRETLRQLLALDGDRLLVTVLHSTAQIGSGKMFEVHGPGSRESRDVRFALAEAGARVHVFLTPPLIEPGMSENDPDVGVYCTATPWRTNPSYVLAIATVIAAAKLAGTHVHDDWGVLGGPPVVDPDAVVAQLKLSDHHRLPLLDAVDEVLRRGLRSR